MRPLPKLACGVVLVAFLWMHGVSGARAAGADYVALIMLDGFRRDYLAMFNLPHLRSLVDTGVWVAEGKGVFPPNTTPNQYSFITGATPAMTRIPNNRYYDRVADCLVASPRAVAVETVVDAVKRAGKLTAVINHFPVLGQADINAGPNASADVAASIIMDKKPTLVVYYYPWTDSVGHKSGPYSPEMQREAMSADESVGKLKEAYRAAGILEQTLFIVASDHGMSSNAAPAIPESVPQALRTAGMKVFDGSSTDSVPDDCEVVLIQVGSCFLYLRDPQVAQQLKQLPPAQADELAARRLLATPTPESYARLLQVVYGLANVTIYDRLKLREMGCDPDLLGDVVVCPDPGWLMLPASGKGGLHGRPQEADVLIVASGAAVKAGTIIPTGSILDIVPTLLSALGLPPLANSEGTILAAALR